MTIDATPFLSAGDREALTGINRQGFATLAVVFPTQAATISLGRWDAATEDWVAVAPQDVRIEIRHERQARIIAASDSNAALVDGIMHVPDPADIVPGDRFTWARGEGMAARLHPAVVVTVDPMRLGIVRAYWRWDSDGVADGGG